MMARDEKRILKLAITIHELLVNRNSKPSEVNLPGATWRACENLLRKMRRAERRGWRLAAERVRRDLHETVQRLQGEMIRTGQAFASRPSELHRVSVGDLYADLLALHDEFEEVSIDRQAKMICVTTVPIELEGVYLGPFEIRLNWSYWAEDYSDFYRVIATDPHSAASKDDVTHPHVDNETVCEGEGQQPIRRALEQGRLLDFFTIVDNLLKTYNSASPYVAIEDWDGVDCADCGETVSGDDRWICEKCDASICDGCYVSCHHCRGIFCSECVTSCPDCDESVCSYCMKACADCHDQRCPDCLHQNESLNQNEPLDKSERCKDCHEQIEEQNEEPNDDETSADGNESCDANGCDERDNNTNADPTLQPERLGEAAVPA